MRRAVIRGAAVLLLVLSASEARAQNSARVDALLGLARVKRDGGDLVQARRFFDDVARLRPLSPGEQVEYFWVIPDSDAAAGISLAFQILQAQPKDSAVRERAITLAVTLGDEERVRRLALEGRALEPNDARWPRRIAESAARRHANAEAVHAYTEVLGLPGATASDRAGLALAEEASGHLGRAAEAWASVPADAREHRPDWQSSFVRVLAATASPDRAAAEVESALRRAPDDRALRALLVDLWSRAKQPQKALDVIHPLTVGTGGDVWLRREAELAGEVGDRMRAVAAFDALRDKGRATAADDYRTIELLIDLGATDRAAALIVGWSEPPCDVDLFLVADRLPDVLATNVMNTLALRDVPSCGANGRGLVRTLDRLVASARHHEARAVFDRLPEDVRHARAMQRLNGQLWLWTGDARAAVPALELVVQRDPSDLIARDALVDAYRGASRSYDAWQAARPLVENATTPDARQRAFVDLALEADEPGAAVSLLDRLSARSAESSWLLEQRGRAALALGQPARALHLLASVPVDALRPEGALALIDAVVSLRGFTAGLEVARQVSRDGGAWQGVFARHAMLEVVAGDLQIAAAMRARLIKGDSRSGAILDAEVALALENPSEALAVLRRVPDVDGGPRTLDLFMTALAGVGEVKQAREGLAPLQATRPRFVPFIVRAAELDWRIAADDLSLASLMTLPASTLGHEAAVLAKARALAGIGRHAEVVAMFADRAVAGTLSLAERTALARSLRAVDRTADALKAIESDVALPGSAGLLRADLLLAVRGWPDANAAYRALAERPEASASVMRAWAAAAPTSADRLAILDAAVVRFPSDAPLWSSLAAARLGIGQPAVARDAAERSIALDPTRQEAWVTAVDATSASGLRPDVDALLDRFTDRAAGDATLVMSMAEHIAGLGKAPDDPLVGRALAWLDAVAGSVVDRDTYDLAHARVLSAGARWTDALEAIQRVLSRDPGHLAAMRLKADVLSWAGQYGAALTSFDVYIGRAPQDIDAWRQRARVAGWAGDYARSGALYQRALVAFPGHAALAAEVAAKTSFFGGRWRSAVPGYERWLAIEPDNREARFELAEARRSLGDVDAADATLRELALRPEGHRLAEAAARRAEETSRPAAAAVVEVRNARGYGGHRMLETSFQGVAVGNAWGHNDATAASLDAGRVTFRAAGESLSGTRLAFAAGRRVNPRVRLDVAFERLDVDGSSGALTSGGFAGQWTVADLWTLSAGADRRPFFERIGAIRERLAGTGAFADVRFESHTGSFDLQVRGEHLSDDNARTQVTVSATRRVSQRLGGLQGVVWGERLGYRDRASTYFSPSAFVHVDAGLEYGWAIRRPRFRGDREQMISFGYLVGVDSRHATYQQPTLRASFELMAGLTLEGRAGRIASADYHETTASVAITVGGRMPALRSR
jgi:tetratricopeptide (TPR) repeat protein